MQEGKAACSFEQTPGGWLPKGKELGSQAWPWISQLPTDQKNHGDNRAVPPLVMLVCRASLARTAEAKGETAHRGPLRPPPDLDAFGTSSPAILLLFNSDMLMGFIKENSTTKKQKPKPYGKPPWTALIICSFTKPKRHFPFFKDEIALNFCLLG